MNEKPLILRLDEKVKELDNKVNSKHELFSGGLHGTNEGEEVSAELNGNVADYNFFIVRVRKWSDAEEETTVMISTLDKANYFRLSSGNKDYYAEFIVTITSDNKVKFRCREIQGWQYRDNIQLEQVWGI